MPSRDLPDAGQFLTYDQRFMDPTLSSGLWFCDGAETVLSIQVNACCLAAGAGWDDLGKCGDFISAFPLVMVVCPDPARRAEMAGQLRTRLPTTLLLVADDLAFRGCATVRALRETYGLEAVDQMLYATTELPAYGLLDLADVTPPDPAEMAHCLSGIAPLDRRIGGFYMGELSVWTGRRGEGKSTLLSQLLLEARNQGRSVCAYSGELPAWKFKYWLSLQAAGSEGLTVQRDPRTGKDLPAVPPQQQAQIDLWLRRHFLLYDVGRTACHDGAQILKLFQYAQRAYGSTVFLVDNIMTARLQTGRDRDFYRAQSDFVSALSGFARQHNVHVHLVAHPRKADRPLESDDVSGIGDITNYADNVFALSRDAATREGTVAAGLSVLKNRFFGDRGTPIALHFDPLSRRFYREEQDRLKRYDWTGLAGAAVGLDGI